MKFTVTLVVVVQLCYLQGSDAACKKLLGRGVSSSEANIIVNRHNAIRVRIANGKVDGQPKGANLKRMSWDVNLAKAAQKIAETCVFAHVKVVDDRFAVGQNLYITGSTMYNKTADYENAINSWFDEYKTYKFGTGTYNHYTQLVWADTYLVGCGHTYNSNNNWYEHLIVCNYGPAGNYIGQTPYEIGPGCENLC